MEIQPHRLGVQALGLVQNQRYRLARASQLANDEMILRGQAGTCVGEEDDAVRFFNSAFSVVPHLRFKTRWILDQPPSVDHDIGNGTQATIAGLAGDGSTPPTGRNSVARPAPTAEEP